ncbi:MAG: hypothetical protein K6A98_04940 [Prevotella sp.]|nr:hypothetical protein [Prevotella sp.]
MRKILSLFSLIMLCVMGVRAQETVIYSWPADATAANTVTLAEGVTVQITGNSDKFVSAGTDITIDGTTYKSMKVSNGAENTLTLPKAIKKITFYSYINKDSSTKESYWKEVDGVEYTVESSGGAMESFKDGANPDVRSFDISNKKKITFTNSGDQLCYVFAVEYAEETLPTTALFDFENNNLSLPVGEGTSFTDGSITDPVTQGEVTLTSEQGNAIYPAIMMKDNSGVISLNVYKNGAIRLSASEGKAITKVEATMKSKSFNMMEASTGTITDNVWEGNATEVTFSASSLMSILKLNVTTADKNSETVEPEVEVFDTEAANIAAFNATEDYKIVKLTLTDAKVNGVMQGSYYVEDASGATVIKGVTLTPGTALNGFIIGTKSSTDVDYVNDPSLAYEYALTASDTYSIEETETMLNGTPMTIPEACAQSNYGRLVTIENVTISGGGQNKTLTDAEGKTMKARDLMGVLPDDYTWPEQAAKITGVVIYYMTGWFVMPISADAIVVDAPATALFDFENNNMEISVGTNEDINAGNLENVAVEQGDVTLTFVSSPVMPTRYYVNGSRGPQLQILKDGQMRVTAAEGKAITAIRVTPNKTTNPSTGAEVINVNWKVDKGDGMLSDDKMTWAGNATSVRLTGTGATYINAIEVETADLNEQTVTPEDDVYEVEVSSLSEFNALDDGTLVKLNLTDAIVTSGMVNEWGCYVQDATAGAHFYCTGLSFNVNDVINGSVYVKKSKQTMGSRIAMTEATNANDLQIAADGSYEPIEGAIADVCVDANINMVVKVANVSLKGSGDDSKKSIATATDAVGTTIEINNPSTNTGPYVIQQEMKDVDYANANVTGILIGASGGKKQIYPLEIEEVNATGINDVKTGADAQEVVIYNIQGVRLSKLQKGINIVNGRKVVVK